jgi:hypothetical protein
MANLTKFVPLDGVPDADARGAGTFHFDDGSFQVAEDPELADLVKSYQDTLPQLEQAHALPDQRLASNDLDPSAYGADPFGQATAPAQVADFLGNAAPDLGPSIALRQSYQGPTPVSSAPVAPDAGSHAAITGAEAASRAAAPAPSGVQQTASDFAAPPSDAQRAADLHRMAGEQALRGSYVPGQKEGYSPAQRSDFLPQDIADRQAQERATANEGVLSSTEQARMQEADRLRKVALDDSMRIAVQRADEQRRQDEAEAKRQRLIDERNKLNDAKIDQSFAQGDGFRQAMALVGSALLGATGSDAGLRMIQSNIDGHVRQQMQVRGSKLQALGEELGDANQAAAGARSKLYELAGREAAAAGKLYDAAGIEHNTPAILQGIKAKQVEAEQEHERRSLGKTVETYHQGRAAGRTGPNLGEAAKQFEAANKLSPQEEAKATEGLERGEIPDFIARMEGLADAEHALNEIDQNIGIQRDGAGDVANAKEIRAGNIEGAGFFGGRTPDSLSSEKGSALSREQRRLIQAQVKASSGAAATDAEREEYGKNLPLGDEKDLVNSTTEERRRWQKNYAKAVSLYGQDRVDRFMGGYRGTRGKINAQRGQAPAVSSAKGRVLQIDPDEPDMSDAEAMR